MTHFIRALREAELPAYRDHLLRLDAADRRLRFGLIISDNGIDAHVQHLRPGADRILAAVQDFDRVVAAVHIACIGEDAAELAFSVDRDWQNRGLGRALFERALSWLCSRGIRRVFLIYLSENGAMRTLARAFGMTLQIDTGEVTAELTLPPATPLDVLCELSTELAALWPAQAWPAPVWPAPVWPAPVWPASVWPTQVWPTQVWPTQVWRSVPWPATLWPSTLWPATLWTGTRDPASLPSLHAAA